MIARTFNWLKNHGKYFLLLTLAVTLVIGVFMLQMWAGHNFHVVSFGQVYRSAQMGPEGLAEVIQENGIKSILNLRGAFGSDWYSSETNVSSQFGVRHFDFELSAGREVKDEEMEQLVAMIEHAPKPILIHCKNGADRTGLAGALYLYRCEGKSAETANAELTVLHGHLPYLFWRDTIAMDRSFWRYVSTHAPRTVPLQSKFSSPLTQQTIILPAKTTVSD